MSGSVSRREFLGTVVVAGLAAGPGAGLVGADVDRSGSREGRSRVSIAPELLQPFDYRGVGINGGRWARQYEMAR